MDELIKTYDEYIKLLGDEIDGLAGLAYVHGWRSSRYEQGKALRDKIESLKKDVLNTTEVIKC